MKKIIIMLILSLIFYGCSSVDIETNTETFKPVEVKQTKNEEHNLYYNYNGIVKADVIKKLSFKYGGEIKEIIINKGDSVNKGDKLIVLDKEELLRKLDDDLENKKIALNNYNKALDTYKYFKDNFQRIKALYENGAISKNEYDSNKLKLDIADADLEIAKNNLNRAENSIKNTNTMIEEFTLNSPSDGIVSDILFEQGENISPGTPVVILKTDKRMLSFGINQNDYIDINIGDQVTVIYNNKKYSSEVKSKDDFPDDTTMTYEVQADLSSFEIPINSIVEVKILKDEIKGYRLPISSIISKEYDYVYVNDKGRAKLKKITIKEIIGSDVICNGLDNNDQVIIEGIKNLNEGDRLKIIR